MSDVVARAKAALARRWEQPGPDYADPVCRGVVELGDWASEYLPELVAEVEQYRDLISCLRDLAGDAEADAKEARLAEDRERQQFLMGERRGLLEAVELLVAIAERAE